MEQIVRVEQRNVWCIDCLESLEYGVTEPEIVCVNADFKPRIFDSTCHLGGVVWRLVIDDQDLHWSTLLGEGTVNGVGNVDPVFI